MCHSGPAESGVRQRALIADTERGHPAHCDTSTAARCERLLVPVQRELCWPACTRDGSWNLNCSLLPDCVTHLSQSTVASAPCTQQFLTVRLARCRRGRDVRTKSGKRFASERLPPDLGNYDRSVTVCECGHSRRVCESPERARRFRGSVQCDSASLARSHTELDRIARTQL